MINLKQKLNRVVNGLRKAVVKGGLVKKVAKAAGFYRSLRSLQNDRRKNVGVVVVCLVVLMSGVVFMYQYNRSGRVLGVDESIEIQVPEWYLEPLEVSRGERSLSVTPLAGKRVRVEKKGNQYIYRNAYVNTDVIHTEYDYKIKEELIFSQSGHPLTFTYRIDEIKKYYIEKDQDNNIVFYDQERYEAQGILSRLFTIPRLYMKDSQNKISYTAVGSEIKEDTLIITLDPDWLESVQYPVILDPTIEINVLNVHSHPQEGDNWVVDFTTVGQADLRIIPDDQATIDDDEFVSLWCDDAQKTP